MKIAVVCANGKAGKLIVGEALNRNMEVTAVVRNENKTAAPQAIVKDLFELSAEDLSGFDAVVDAFGTWNPETLPQHSTSLKHLCDILSGTETHLLVVGGAGSLYVNPEHTVQVMDGADFPEEFKPLAAAQGKALDELRDEPTCAGPSFLLLLISRQTASVLVLIFSVEKSSFLMMRENQLLVMPTTLLQWLTKSKRAIISNSASR